MISKWPAVTVEDAGFMDKLRSTSSWTKREYIFFKCYNLFTHFLIISLSELEDGFEWLILYNSWILNSHWHSFSFSSSATPLNLRDNWTQPGSDGYGFLTLGTVRSCIGKKYFGLDRVWIGYEYWYQILSQSGIIGYWKS